MILHVILDPDGTRRTEPYPVLPNLRVAWPKFGGYVVAGALAPGDFVTILFDEWSCDLYRQNGASGTPQDPIDLARHTIGSAVAYPGGADPKGVGITEDLSQGLVIGKDGGVVARFKPSGVIELGTSGSAFDPVALATNTENRLAAIETALNTGIPVVGGGGGNTTPQSFNLPTPHPVAAAQVKAV